MAKDTKQSKRFNCRCSDDALADEVRALSDRYGISIVEIVTSALRVGLPLVVDDLESENEAMKQ